MKDAKYPKTPDLESFEKHENEKLIIIPKKILLDWYKHTNTKKQPELHP